VDECFSCSTADQGEIDSVTVQWSIISEALENSIHEKGPHSYGALIRGCYGARYTYHHNLFAHNRSRNPRPGNYDENTYLLDPEGLRLDFRNNVIYNWKGSRPGYDGDTESVCRYNYVGNYGKPGPDSDSDGYAYSAGCKHFRAFYEGNHFFGEIPDDQWSLVNFSGTWTDQEKSDYKQTEPFSTGPMVTESAQDAFTHVIEHAGASRVRDVVDQRVINDVLNGTGSIIDDEDEVGGWPVYETYGIRPDTDLDGMPDEWEIENGLNPGDPEDRNGDLDSDGYTNLEEYLHEVISISPVSSRNGSPVKQALLQCYPNPARSELFVDLSGFGSSSLKIIDITGQPVFSRADGAGIQKIQVDKLAPGIYLLLVSDEKEGVHTRKVIIN
jgi:hypothetical protein